jgi:ribosomal-protein-alanine N-acetyltransferase
MTKIRLETDRLTLREFVEDDWRTFLEASGAEEVRHMHEEPFTEEDAKRWVAIYMGNQTGDPRTRYELAVVVGAEGRLIGYCDLVLRAPLECRMAYSGFRYNRKYWGRGYGTEALGAILDFGFGQFGLHRVSLICDPENKGAWRTMEKNGLRREGHGIADRWEEGTWIDTYYYAILREEWQRRKDDTQPAVPRDG